MQRARLSGVNVLWLMVAVADTNACNTRHERDCSPLADAIRLQKYRSSANLTHGHDVAPDSSRAQRLQSATECARCTVGLLPYCRQHEKGVLQRPDAQFIRNR